MSNSFGLKHLKRNENLYWRVNDKDSLDCKVILFYTSTYTLYISTFYI